MLCGAWPLLLNLFPDHKVCISIVVTELPVFFQLLGVWECWLCLIFLLNYIFISVTRLLAYTHFLVVFMNGVNVGMLAEYGNLQSTCLVYLGSSLWNLEI